MQKAISPVKAGCGKNYKLVGSLWESHAGSFVIITIHQGTRTGAGFRLTFTVSEFERWQYMCSILSLHAALGLTGMLASDKHAQAGHGNMARLIARKYCISGFAFSLDLDYLHHSNKKLSLPLMCIHHGLHRGLEPLFHSYGHTMNHICLVT